MIPMNVTDDFHFPARNSRGLDTTIGFRFWPEFDQEADRIISKKTFNYKTKADLLRHALWRHLQWLGEKNTELKKRVSWYEASLEMIRAEGRFREYQTITNSLSREIQEQERREEPEQARKLALKVINLINEADMPEDMKKRYLTRIMKRHGRLLRQLNGQ